MLRRLTWMSWVLLIATAIYWAATWRVPDLSRVGANEQFPVASCVIGKVELAWVVNRSGPVVWVASEGGDGKTLPLLRRVGLLRALFSEIKWSDQSQRAYVPLVGGVLTFRGSSASGSPITARLLFCSYLPLWILFGMLPAIATMRAGARRSGRTMRRMRLSCRRRARAKVGICWCGYDLRGSRGRCPECGRAIRLVPVPLA
jgi:hypothetical protein